MHLFNNKLTAIVIGVVLAGGTAAIFWQVHGFDFVSYDDDLYVYENPHVTNGLTRDGVFWAFTTGQAGNWHPLTWLSLMLDCQLFGPRPGGLHLVNLLLHIANTLLLFTVLKKMTDALWSSAFVAAVFALHPMHVESVAWIAERKDVLSTLFWMLTLLAYVGYVKRPGLLRYMTTILLFALGLMAKPMLVTLPFVLLLLDYWPLNRFGPQTAKTSGRQSYKSGPAGPKFQNLYRVLFEKIPFFVLCAISSVITFLVQQSGGAVVGITALPLNSRVTNAFLSYAKYIGKMFWPQNLAIFYPFDLARFEFWQILLCILLLLFISIFVIYAGRKRRYLAVGWFWFVITLVPVIGFVQVGNQALADRYTYIPYIGLFIMIAWGLPELLSEWPYRKIAFGISIVVVLTALGISTYRQVGYWKNSFILFSHAIEVTQGNYLAYNNLGNAYCNLGRYREAVEAYRQAIKIKPDYAKAHNNLGNAYWNLGRHQESIEAYKQAVRKEPDYADAQYNLGNAYCNLGRYQEAIEAYQQAIKLKPDNAVAYNNLGFAYGKLGRYDEEIEAFGQAVRIKPDYAVARNNLADALLKQGTPYIEPAPKQ
jgi:Flp pilus assembly protein TadD